VVTAAHCTDILTQINYTVSEFRVKLAEHDLSTSKDCAYLVGGNFCHSNMYL
jgi:hypothetical protein